MSMIAENGQRQGPKELLAAMAGGRLYRRAAEAGTNLSAWLERQDPSDQYQDGTDAFTRLVREAGIVTRSHRYGNWAADRFEAFGRNDSTRALVPEWLYRQWRAVSLGGARPDPQTRAIYFSDDTALGTALRPYFTAPGAMPDSQLAPAIPLSEVVAVSEMIDHPDFRAIYIKRDATQLRMKRVTEGANLPVAKLQTTERAITAYKYGVALEASYEALRRLPIDLVAFFVQLLAVQSEVDKVVAIMDILVNGDGNSGTAATSYNLTALDSAAVAGTLTLAGWVAFKMKFANPYMMTTAIAQEATARQALLLNTGSGNWPTQPAFGETFGGQFRPINPGLNSSVALGWDSNAPALKIIGFDKRFAIRRVTEIGSQISEIERWTLNQTQILTMSEVEGYANLDTGANKILNVNA